MNAKDTVKLVPDHSETISCLHCGEEFGIEDKVLMEREFQADITFKAGIKEVVEFIRKDLPDIHLCLVNGSKYPKKLKEWGL